MHFRQLPNQVGPFDEGAGVPTIGRFFEAMAHARATARLRDVLGRSVRCRMFLFFGCHRGKELPDDGFFTATLIKYMRQRALDVHDMARAVIQEVCQATQHCQWPLSISRSVRQKVDARGLMDNLEVQRYVGGRTHGHPGR